jgi:hypothetical protein
VPPPYAGRAQNLRTRLAGRCLRWALLAVPVLAPVALIGGTYLLHEVGVRRNLVPEWAVLAYVVGFGLTSLVFLHWARDACNDGEFLRRRAARPPRGRRLGVPVLPAGGDRGPEQLGGATALLGRLEALCGRIPAPPRDPGPVVVG